MDFIKVAITLSVALSSNWFWRIYRQNPVLAFLLVLISLSLIAVEISAKLKKENILKAIIFLCLVLSLMLTKPFDGSLFSIGETEQYLVNQESSYFPLNLGRVFKNKDLLAFGKLEDNFFSDIDLNLYFFASHPRERSGVKEFSKFSSLLIPFFILGIFQVFIKKNKLLQIYFGASILISSFLYQDYSLGPFLLFPILVNLIALGIVDTYLRIKKIHD